MSSSSTQISPQQMAGLIMQEAQHLAGLAGHQDAMAKANGRANPEIASALANAARANRKASKLLAEAAQKMAG